MIMQGCVISCGTVVFFQKPRNLSRSLVTNNNFYCEKVENPIIFDINVDKRNHEEEHCGTSTN